MLGIDPANIPNAGSIQAKVEEFEKEAKRKFVEEPANMKLRMSMRKIFQMKRVMRNKDNGLPLFITSAACMSRSMSGMGSELIGDTLKPKYHSDSAGRAQDSQWLSALRGPERSGDRSYVEQFKDNRRSSRKLLENAICSLNYDTENTSARNSYYDDPKDNLAFERCIEVMSRLMMKYGPALLEKMEREKLDALIRAEIEPAADSVRLSKRLLGYCQLMKDRK